MAQDSKNMRNSKQVSRQNDKVDLFDLCLILWARKKTIFAITTAFTLLALIYVFFIVTPIYKAQSVLRPASLKSLEVLNSTDILKISPTRALYDIESELDSYDNRLRFFRKNTELFEPLINPGESLEQSFERFNEKAFTLTRPETGPDGSIPIHFVRIDLEYPGDINGVEILNKFVEFAINEEKKQIEDDFQALLNNKTEQLERQLIGLRTEYQADKEAKIINILEQDALKRAQLSDELEAVRNELEMNRKNRLEELQEAIDIASALGINKPTLPTQLDQSLTGTLSFYADFTNQPAPLYFMGTEALEAEYRALLNRRSNDFTSPRITEIKKELQLLEDNRQIELLKSRENEDLFIIEQAELKKQLALLENIHVDFDTLEIVRIDQIAHPPYSSFKPDKKLIITVAFLVGILVGTFIVLMQAATAQRRTAL